MNDFLTVYCFKIVDVLGCFDRMLFRGHLPILDGKAMTGFIRAPPYMASEKWRGKDTGRSLTDFRSHLFAVRLPRAYAGSANASDVIESG